MQKETIVDLLFEFKNEFENIIANSTNCCIALFNLNGKLLFSNNGMTTLIKTGNPIENLINPTYEQLLAINTSTPLVFEGFLTIGDNLTTNSSLGAKVYRKNDKLLIFGEVSGVQLLAQNATMHTLNREINILQRNLIKEKHVLQTVLGELNEANEALKELNATKDKFFSILAHDLKSPFNSIIGFSELLAENASKYSSEKVELIAGNLLKSSKNTFELLENLLAWSSLQRGKLTPKITPLNYYTIINNIQSLCKPIAKSKNINLDIELDSVELIKADEQMLHTILRNLVTNSIKFTHPLGSIKITTQNLAKEVLFTVSDTGIGIATSNFDKLFSILCDLSTPGTQNEKGTGLGLILCKDFVEIQGGKIWVESEVGVGSLFKFTIPKLK